MKATYRCSRIGHPRCQPDVRADGDERQQRGELLRPGVRTELRLLSVRPLRTPAVQRGVSPASCGFGTTATDHGLRRLGEDIRS